MFTSFLKSLFCGGMFGFMFGFLAVVGLSFMIGRVISDDAGTSILTFSVLLGMGFGWLAFFEQFEAERPRWAR